MSGAQVPGRSRAAEFKRAIARILIYLGLFVVLVFVGGLIVPAASAESRAGIVAGSVVMAVAALAAGALPIMRLDGRPVGALGVAWTRKTLSEVGLGFGIGALAIAVAALVMVVANGLIYTPEPGTAGQWAREAASGLVVLTPAAAAEELLFRGYAFQWLVRAAGVVTGTLVGSAVFAAAHLSNPDPSALALANLFLAGVLLSVAYLKTRSLWFATAVHLGWNWMMAVPLDLPVSGFELFNAPFYEPVLAGPALLTGGAFGPEGGIAATLGAGLALLALWKLPVITESSEMRALSPLIDRDETERA
jgi:membrane protease YdiL (CAAX protease family)